MLFANKKYVKYNIRKTKYVAHDIGRYNMDRLKNRVRFSTSLDKKTVEMLKKYSNKTMIPISKIVDMAVQDYIKERDH